MVTVQLSPLSSPLSAPVRWTTLEASSSLSRQAPVVSSLTSSDALPLRTREALSYFQHRSYCLLWPSLAHEPYCRSMYDTAESPKPSPTSVPWLFVEELRPSTDPES
ncbi:hypothetical protein SCALM49S_02190 [Streptomyces californicus]